MKKDYSDHLFPLDALDGDAARAIFTAHPRILILRHPVRGDWQVWEQRPYCSQWTAPRLVQLMIAEQGEKAAPDTFGAYDWQKVFWWNWRGAPWLVDGHLPQYPGIWMMPWLADSSISAVDYLKSVEEENEKREDARRREREDMHYAYASDHYQFWRDVAEQDPMAGHRHWSAPVAIDLVPHSGGAPK
jgi:hypothetical protein